MKIQIKSLWLLIGLVLIQSCCQKEEGFIIKGEVTGFEDGEIMVLQSFDDNIIVDSCRIKNGAFTFKGKVDYPKKFFVRNHQSHKKNVSTIIYVDNTNIELKGSHNKFRICEVKGGKSQEVENKFTSKAGKIMHELDSLDYYLSHNWNKLPSIDKEKIKSKIQALHKQVRKTELAFLRENFNSYPGLDRLTKNPPLVSKSELRTFYYQLSDELKNSAKGKIIYSRYIDVPIAIGNHYADFEAKHIDGSVFKLSEIKDKFILLNFTELDCGWCEKFDKDLAKHYGKIKDKIEVVYFYCISDKKAWNNHITESGYKWTIVSDLKGEHSPIAIKYNITGVPHQFIIDKKGIIIKDNSGYLPELIDELEKLITPKE